MFTTLTRSLQLTVIEAGTADNGHSILTYFNIADTQALASAEESADIRIFFAAGSVGSKDNKNSSPGWPVRAATSSCHF